MPSINKISASTTLQTQQHNLSGPIGAIAGVLVSAFFQPLEIFKIALIMAPNNTTNVSDQVSSVFKGIINDNGWKGFWKGLTPAIIKNSLGSSFYFFVLKKIQKEDSSIKLSPFINSAFARIVSCIAINPFTVLQTRFLMPGVTKYNSIWGAILKIYNYEGPNAFFKGSIPVCYKEGIFAGIYYSLYVRVKSTKDQFNLIDSFGSGLFAGSVATIFSHPFEIVRARMQSGVFYDYFGVIQAFKKIYNQQGMKGYMKGILPRLVRKPLINSSTFVIYEIIQNILKKHLKEY